MTTTRAPTKVLQFRLTSIALLLLLEAKAGIAETEDYGYVDPTFNCPATTTCPQLCVSEVEACPSEMLCATNMTLCQDGTCRNSFLECEGESPCTSVCAPVACSRLVTTYDVCTGYEPLYEFASECAATSSTANSTSNNGNEYDLSWNGPQYVAGYVWLATVTMGIILWCWFK